MQAQASDSKLIFYWVSSTRDYAGAGYPGTGTPEEVAVAAFQPADVSGVVDSFNGRTGAVFPESGDYSAAEVSFDDSTNELTSTDVQGAIEELAAPSGIETIPDGYSITTADAGAFLVYDSASDGNYSFPASLLPGQSLEIQQKGAGSIAPVGLPGQTFNSPRFTGQFPRTSGPGAVVKIRCTATDEYSFTGDLETELPSARYALESGSTTAQNGVIPIEQTVGYGGVTFDAANGQVIVPQTGKYLVFGSIYCSNDQTTNPLSAALAIRVNNTGSFISRAQLTRWSSSTSTNFGCEWSELWELQAGDFVTVENLNGNVTVFSGSADQERSRCGILWVSD